jgi:hypothetical protein
MYQSGKLVCYFEQRLISLLGTVAETVGFGVFARQIPAESTLTSHSTFNSAENANKDYTHSWMILCYPRLGIVGIHFKKRFD